MLEQYSGLRHKNKDGGPTMHQRKKWLMPLISLILISTVPLLAKNDNELVLPMPNGESMAFVPICVNSGDGLFNWKQVKLGDPAGGFKEYPTSMALGGSFLLDQNGTKMWCYYMGKYEVTRGEYYAIINNNPNQQINKKNYPITNISWFDAIAFTNQYNQWLYSHAADKIPKFDKAYGFLRLPTEAEWEFAARGGSNVSADFFDRAIPYPPEELQKYEWFGGPISSHYKLQMVGQLKPNPVGLYDMLGNADEMTMTLFKVEYYQGRTGGFVIKGNNYTTAGNKIRSAFRTEQPFYRISGDKSFKPHTKKTLGFRLLISSLVFPSRTIHKQMASEWLEYRKNQGATTPAALSTARFSRKTQVKGEDAFAYLKRLQDQLKSKGINSSTIENNIGRLKASIQDIIKIRTQKEEDASYLWIKIASEQARFIRQESQKLPLVKTLIEIAKSKNDTQKLEAYRQRYKERKTNIRSALSTYSDSIRQIAQNTPAAVKKGFKRYLDFLTEHNDVQQVHILNKVHKHLDQYEKTKRVDSEKWKKDLIP